MSCNILIVDDSQMTRAMVRRIITLCGAPDVQIFDAEDGVQGLIVLVREQINLVLADLHMPKMGGLEMTRRMRSDPHMKDIPVVIISADPNLGRFDQQPELNIKGQLAKPFTPESFRSIFTDVLGVPAHA